MGIFFKKHYETAEFPFQLDDAFEEDKKETEEALFIDLVFYGMYGEKQMYFCVTFQYYDEEDYAAMLQYLRHYEHNTPVKLMIHAGKIQDFRVDLDDMAEKLSNARIRKFERICWGALDEEAFRDR